jgi:hypothetical protein
MTSNQSEELLLSTAPANTIFNTLYLTRRSVSRALSRAEREPKNTAVVRRAVQAYRLNKKLRTRKREISERMRGSNKL